MNKRPVASAPATFAVGSLLLASFAAHSAGFQLNETSVSGLGTAFAGGAAEAADASTLWSNVGGMSRLGESQESGVLHLITPSLRFRNVGSAAAGQRLGRGWAIRVVTQVV